MLNKKKCAAFSAALISLPIFLGFNSPDSKNDATENPAAPVTDSADSEKTDSPENPAVDEAEDLPENFTDPVTNYTFRSDVSNFNFMRQFDGKTIVDVIFEGSEGTTLNAAKNAVLSHVGEAFDARLAARDLSAIENLGFFQEAYLTFRQIPEGVIVTYHLNEQPILKRVVFTGNTVYSDDELQKLVTARRNAIANKNTIHDNLLAIEEKYHADGYIKMYITDHHFDLDGTLNVKINEGILEGYQFRGNVKTKDYVLMREMRQKVGEPFNSKLARRSFERINNLGFFEEVTPEMIPGVELNSTILGFNVKERRTGTFHVGAGYSTRDGLIGIIGISDSNFRGTGDSVSVEFETSADSEDSHGFSFSYTRPWLDSRETAGTFRILNRTYQYYDYDTDGELKERYMRKSRGAEITVSRPMSEYSKNYFTVKQRKESYLRHVSDGKSGDRSGVSGESWRNSNFGTTRSVAFYHVTDTRYPMYNPETGGRVSIGGEFAGFLGGDFSFQKYQIEHQQFWKAGHAQVWALKLGYGIGHGDLTEFNQFRVGGQSSLRGYRDDQFRGSHMLISSFEYRFPLAKSVQGIVFTDWGGAWGSGFIPKGNDIYGSGGLGIALNTPMGPLRLDYGHGSQGGRYHFSFGTGF